MSMNNKMPDIGSLTFNNKRIAYITKLGSKYKNTVMFHDPATGVPFAHMKLNSNRKGETLILYMGTTYPNYRRKGIGEYLRAHIIKAAKNAGFKYVTQNSVNLEGMGANKPASAYIMEKLGGVRNSNNNYHYTFNLSKNLPKGVTNTLRKNPRI